MSASWECVGAGNDQGLWRCSAESDDEHAIPFLWRAVICRIQALKHDVVKQPLLRAAGLMPFQPSNDARSQLSSGR